MRHATNIREILLYLFRPEDTTAAGGEDLAHGLPPAEEKWLGPLKAVFWSGMAVAGPLLLCALLS